MQLTVAEALIPDIVKLGSDVVKLLPPTCQLNCGAAPPKSRVANKFTSCPTQITFLSAVIEMLGVPYGDTKMVNEFDVAVTVDIAMVPINSRIIVGSFDNVVIPAQSKKQLEMQVDVIAPGQTTVSAIITGPEDDTEIVPEAILTLNSSVIDSRVTWFTTGSAILLLLAAVAQSVRRVRRRAQ